MKIGIDIDGVISDFVTSFRKHIKKKYGVDFAYEDIQQHDLYKVLGISEEETLDCIKETFQYDLDLMPGAAEGINQLYQKHTIILITARPTHTKAITKQWLNQKKIFYHDLYFLNEGEKHAIEENGFDVVIDDHLSEVIRWVGKVPIVLVFNHPWNKSLNIKNNFKRVYNWENILEELT